MIGTKKLATIRKQIEAALASDNSDPIHELDKQVSGAKRKGERTEVLDGLRRFLEPRRKQRRGKRGAATKK